MTVARHALREDCAAIGRSLAGAFADDPIWRWLIPDNARWEARSANFFTAEAGNHIRGGHVYTDAQCRGVAEWAPPGHPNPSVSDLIREAIPSLRLFGTAIPKALSFLARVEKAHPRRPDHWYLAMLGTHPDHQGRGLGSALLQPILETCDRDGTPAYLESSKKSNVAFYARHGFELRDPVLTDGGPTLFPMWRDPRP